MPLTLYPHRWLKLKQKQHYVFTRCKLEFSCTPSGNIKYLTMLFFFFVGLMTYQRQIKALFVTKNTKEFHSNIIQNNQNIEINQVSTDVCIVVYFLSLKGKIIPFIKSNDL